METYQTGDRLKMIRGSYNAHKYSTLNCQSGLEMCFVKVDKDNMRHQKRRWLSSIMLIKEVYNHKPNETSDDKHSADSDKTINILMDT